MNVFAQSVRIFALGTLLSFLLPNHCISGIFFTFSRFRRARLLSAYMRRRCRLQCERLSSKMMVEKWGHLVAREEKRSPKHMREKKGLSSINTELVRRWWSGSEVEVGQKKKVALSPSCKELRVRSSLSTQLSHRNNFHSNTVFLLKQQ